MGGGLPFDPRPQRCYQARPSGKILPGSLHIPASAGLVLQPHGAARTLFMAAPFSSPCLQAPKASGQVEGGLWGQGSPRPSFPAPPLNPAGRRKEGAGCPTWGPSRLLTVSAREEADPPGRVHSTRPLVPPLLLLLCDLGHTA